jgi:hypothetical protein
MSIPDLGTPEGIAVVVMLIVGLAKWKVDALTGSWTLLVVLGMAMTLAMLHVTLIDKVTDPGALFQASIVGVLGTAYALGVSAAVRAAVPKSNGT